MKKQKIINTYDVMVNGKRKISNYSFFLISNIIKKVNIYQSRDFKHINLFIITSYN
jgi:hypothetical protein